MKKWVLMMVMALASPIVAFDPATDCSEDIMQSFFPKIFTMETLKKYQIPQDKWVVITEELYKQDMFVINTIEERAQRMNPNPLLDPNARDQREILFQEVLWDLFSKVMMDHGVTDEKELISMLEEIQNLRLNRWQQCSEALSPPEGNAPPR